jgi:hypothetical protein
MKIEITLHDLIDIIKEYDLDKDECNPLDCIGFCNYIFNKIYYNKDKVCSECGKPIGLDSTKCL